MVWARTDLVLYWSWGWRAVGGVRCGVEGTGEDVVFGFRCVCVRGGVVAGVGCDMEDIFLTTTDNQLRVGYNLIANRLNI